MGYSLGRPTHRRNGCNACNFDVTALAVKRSTQESRLHRGVRRWCRLTVGHRGLLIRAVFDPGPSRVFVALLQSSPFAVANRRDPSTIRGVRVDLRASSYSHAQSRWWASWLSPNRAAGSGFTRSRREPPRSRCGPCCKAVDRCRTAAGGGTVLPRQANHLLSVLARPALLDVPPDDIAREWEGSLLDQAQLRH